MQSLSVILLAACFFSLPVLAEETVGALNAVSGDEILLKNGHILRLAGVKAATPKARAVLNALSSEKPLFITEAIGDRYGRIVALAKSGETSLEEAVLREGMAFVYPGVGGADYDRLFNAEVAARAAHIGFWKTNTFAAPSAAKTLLGTYGFVEGVVSRAERIKNKVYVSLGENRDFTVVIAAKFLRPLRKNGIDALALKGASVHVRGMVVEIPGPGIVLSNLYQLRLAE
ncbi:MAG: thermonuclease family protein [Alphaproteobacteria bacterium]|nr:thermonuclease family protein [Alphaproteobacteria bacterium]